jgi:3-mercaptopyruvate sulfurtransferase SseA
MMALGFLLIAGAGLIYSNRGAQPLPESPGGTVTEDPLSEVPRVSLADAKAAYDNSSAVFVDVRDAESYAQGHIPGALSIPLTEIPNRSSELDPSDWIITY